ncbi:MAG TPA: SDR family NAD(P)-dependent oxidoreductase [Gemmatimonadales bacterium]|nr:SDR family NAD(P)-dependent oxidoreductase [Gemmatimonadales bacterium]
MAVVTGASRGIGAEIARRLAGEGARVVASARTLEPDERAPGSLAQTVDEIRASGGEAVAIRCDISHAEDRAHLIDEATARVGPIDILVNNAAATFMMPLEQWTRKRFDLMVETQMWAPFELSQLVVPAMRSKGEGWILNITSRAAAFAEGPPFDAVQEQSGFSIYGAVKAGLDRMSNSLGAELRPFGIRVNALAPWDNVATPGASHHDLVEGFALEDISLMADAALALCTGDPDRTGLRVYTQPFLRDLGVR